MNRRELLLGVAATAVASSSVSGRLVYDKRLRTIVREAFIKRPRIIDALEIDGWTLYGPNGPTRVGELIVGRTYNVIWDGTFWQIEGIECEGSRNEPA
jgi:hypothetical protein